MLKNSILLILLVLFTGCGLKETTTQYRDKAYLLFNKSYNKTYTVVVNDNNQFELKNCYSTNNQKCTDSSKDTLYEVSAGTNNIKVYDDQNNLLLEDEFYIGSNNTKEIDLP
ncbi:hypothetical protein CRV01_01715 [Arcobacter sp. CECT 8983]|uniref:hypothetical protein n=1 Tax=Arcobacter sp. CECT 8983 TaxID=2044508 RepID=UPI00100AD7AF|nr:hypothetical protein [Arcobacter sp. CECT 8983]RXJ91835.1 hypothetical protein CRV01_01715 [Arcobacter sp. CECT 8983]